MENSINLQRFITCIKGLGLNRYHRLIKKNMTDVKHNIPFFLTKLVMLILVSMHCDIFGSSRLLHNLNFRTTSVKQEIIPSYLQLTFSSSFAVF